MGGGDAKLAALIGLVAGWPGVLVAVFAAFAVGAAAGLLLIAIGRLSRRQPLPFAPALAFGAATAIKPDSFFRIKWSEAEVRSAVSLSGRR